MNTLNVTALTAEEMMAIDGGEPISGTIVAGLIIGGIVVAGVGYLIGKYVL